jgi:CheY-like chemotaxis protein
MVMAKILIVEDDHRSAAAIGDACEAAGHTVAFATNGVEALRTLGSAERYDVWLVDIGLPKMDGLSLTRVVRSNHLHGHLPIIAVTGRDGQADREAMEAAGMTRILIKPLDPAVLRRTIDEVLSQSTRPPQPVQDHQR